MKIYTTSKQKILSKADRLLPVGFLFPLFAIHGSVRVNPNEKYVGFMEYDYSQTQGVWNDKAGSKAIEGYDFRPILGAVANWDDGDASTGYYHFTESWRSVKTQGWCINAALYLCGKCFCGNGKTVWNG